MLLQCYVENITDDPHEGEELVKSPRGTVTDYISSEDEDEDDPILVLHELYHQSLG